MSLALLRVMLPTARVVEHLVAESRRQRRAKTWSPLLLPVLVHLHLLHLPLRVEINVSMSSRDPLLWRCCKGLSWGELAATSRATTSGLTTRDKPKSAILTEQSTQDTRMFAAAERTWSQSRKWVRRDEIRQQQPGKGPANDMNIESRHWLG